MSTYQNEGTPPRYNFATALESIKSGWLMQRAEWNGKGMFIFFVPGSTFKVNRAPLMGIFPEGTQVNYHGHIDIKAADGTISPWVPSQADLLAEDWIEYIKPGIPV